MDEPKVWNLKPRGIPRRPDLWEQLRSRSKGDAYGTDKLIYYMRTIASDLDPKRMGSPAPLKAQKGHFRSLAGQLTKLKETIEHLSGAQWIALEQQLNAEARKTLNAPQLPFGSKDYAKSIYERRRRQHTARDVSKSMGAKVLPDVYELAIRVASLEHIALACQVLAKKYDPSGISVKELIAIRIKHAFEELELRFTTSETSLAAHAFRAIASELEALDDNNTVEHWLSKAKGKA